MKKVTIIALHLGYGGIEKAISSLANMLCENYKVDIISTYKLLEKPAFYIDKKVKIKYLMSEIPNREEFKKSFKSKNFIAAFKEGVKSVNILYKKRKLMIDAIKEIKSDVVISTIPFHNNLLSKYGSDKSIKIAWEHSHHNNNQKYIKNLINSCDNIDYLVSVSKELNNFYKSMINNKKTKCKYVSLTLDYIPEEVSKLNKKEITAIGRLSKEKGLLDLIEVFREVNKKHPDWHLNIVGDGPERENINAAIKTNNLCDNVTMHGFKNKDEVNEILSNTSLYVMTSFTESFGLVLIEAMSFGIPCLSFDSARGSLEIIDNNINGFIIKNRNIKKMSNKIIELIEDKNFRKLIGKESRRKSLNYGAEKVKNEWFNLIEGEEKNEKSK